MNARAVIKDEFFTSSPMEQEDESNEPTGHLLNQAVGAVLDMDRRGKERLDISAIGNPYEALKKLALNLHEYGLSQNLANQFVKALAEETTRKGASVAGDGGFNEVTLQVVKGKPPELDPNNENTVFFYTRNGMVNIDYGVMTADFTNRGTANRAVKMPKLDELFPTGQAEYLAVRFQKPRGEEIGGFEQASAELATVMEAIGPQALADKSGQALVQSIENDTVSPETEKVIETLAQISRVQNAPAPVAKTEDKTAIIGALQNTLTKNTLDMASVNGGAVPAVLVKAVSAAMEANVQVPSVPVSAPIVNVQQLQKEAVAVTAANNNRGVEHVIAPTTTSPASQVLKDMASSAKTAPNVVPTPATKADVAPAQVFQTAPVSTAAKIEAVVATPQVHNIVAAGITAPAVSAAAPVVAQASPSASNVVAATPNVASVSAPVAIAPTVIGAPVSAPLTSTTAPQILSSPVAAASITAPSVVQAPPAAAAVVLPVSQPVSVPPVSAPVAIALANISAPISTPVTVMDAPQPSTVLAPVVAQPATTQIIQSLRQADAPSVSQTVSFITPAYVPPAPKPQPVSFVNVPSSPVFVAPTPIIQQGIKPAVVTRPSAIVQPVKTVNVSSAPVTTGVIQVQSKAPVQTQASVLVQTKPVVATPVARPTVAVSQNTVNKEPDVTAPQKSQPKNMPLQAGGQESPIAQTQQGVKTSSPNAALPNGNPQQNGVNPQMAVLLAAAEEVKTEAKKEAARLDREKEKLAAEKEKEKLEDKKKKEKEEEEKLRRRDTYEVTQFGVQQVSAIEARRAEPEARKESPWFLEDKKKSMWGDGEKPSITVKFGKCAGCGGGACATCGTGALMNPNVRKLDF